MTGSSQFTFSCLFLLLWALPSADGHGFLKTPRSRNLYAYEETSWNSITADDPEPEVCPHCLNQGGPNLSRCGITGDHNYDRPRNAVGGLMKAKVQATYTQGEEITVDVTLTAHHQGHFVFSVCPIEHGESPTQDCFDKHHLSFVEDLFYGANYDPRYPERAYVAPKEYSMQRQPPSNSKVTEEDIQYSFKMRLPQDVYGDLVLIQWYYLTANSCIHEGYVKYEWPSDWDYEWLAGNVGVDLCGPESAEKFWNCAEVKIKKSSKNRPNKENQSGGNAAKNKPEKDNKPGRPNKDNQSGGIAAKNKPEKDKQPGKRGPRKKKQAGKNKKPGPKKTKTKKSKNGRNGRTRINHTIHDRLKTHLYQERIFKQP